MTKIDDVFEPGSRHDLFYMENAGGASKQPRDNPLSTSSSEHLPSCFAFEEEKGADWHGNGKTPPIINEAHPSL